MANPIVYHCLTPDRASAMLLGNGLVGITIAAIPQGLRLIISRTDLWNAQGRMGAVAELLLRPSEDILDQATWIEQRCDLADAQYRLRAPQKSDSVDGYLGIRITVPRGIPAVVIETDHPTPTAWSVELHGLHDDDQLLTTADTIGLRHINTTSPFDQINACVGVDARAEGFTDPIFGRQWAMVISSEQAETHDRTLKLPAACRHRLIVGVTACSPGGSDPEPEARALAKATSREVEGWMAVHQTWWKAFWERSYIELQSVTGDAEYEQRLWYVALFHIACGSPAAGESLEPFPIRFNGGPFLLDGDERCWDNGYWFQNMREVYWPLFSAGHVDLIRPFFEWYKRNAKFVEAQTRSVFGIGGGSLSFRETQLCWGASPDVDVSTGRVNPGTHWHLCQNLELCLLMDWYARMTGDESFARDTLYPLAAGIVEFYRAIMQQGSDGRVHLGPVNALETFYEVIDPMPDIAGLHVVLPRLMELAGRFRKDDPRLPAWREMYAALPPIPVGSLTTISTYDHDIHRFDDVTAVRHHDDGHLLPFGAMTTSSHRRHNMENPELYAVFPFGLVGLGHEGVQLRRAELAWAHRTWRYINNGWAQDVPQLARLGEAEQAASRSLEHASYAQRFPSGAFISPARAHFHGLLTANPYFDSAGVHATGINEMLLQSHDGVVRIAPAVSRSWSGRFRLHSLDGFVVEAEFHQGEARRARITAIRSGNLRLVNHRSQPLRMDTTPQRIVDPGAIVEVALNAGETVEALWDDVPPVEFISPAPDVVWPGFRHRPPPRARPQGHWHDERSGHGQVGLLKDGMYPATRV